MRALGRFFSLAISLFVLGSGVANAQCSCYDCPVLLPDVTTTTFTGEVVVINSVNNVLGVNNQLEQVCIDITHTWIGDLDVTLTAPDGTSVLLFADGNNDFSLGGNEGSPFGNLSDDMDVCFTLSPATNTFGAMGTGACTAAGYDDPCNDTGPCYTGNWGTWDEGCLGGTGIADFNNGTGTVSGTWTISINDNAGGNSGTLNDITLVFTNAPDSCATIPPPAPALCGNTTVVPIPDSDPANPAQSVIVNSGSVGNVNAGTDIVSVCMLIQHTWNSDLDIFLIEPDGTSMELSTDNGGINSNYGDVGTGTEMCFTPTATSSITGYVAGATGDWAPEGSFTIFDGPANGNWTLEVGDDLGGDVGSILSWSIEFTNGDCATGCVITNTITDSFCLGQSYVFNSTVLTSPGTYTDTINLGTCDSVITLTLNTATPVQTNLPFTICDGDSVTVNGTDYYSTAGTYYDTLSASDGCDSVLVIDVSLSPYSTRKGLYGAAGNNYYTIDPETGGVISTINTTPINAGWINGAFTIRQRNGRIYWISEYLQLHRLNVNNGAELVIPTQLTAEPFFHGLRYYNGHLYSISVSGDNDKRLVRIDPGTGNLDGTFSIEINGTAGTDLAASSSLVVDPVNGILYAPLENDRMMAFDIGAGTGSLLTYTGYAFGPRLNLLEIDEYTGIMYALGGFDELVSLTRVGATLDVTLIKAIANGSGYTNAVSTFDADNGRFIYQAATGCFNAPLIAIDVNTGQEWCTNPAVPNFQELEFLNCFPSNNLRLIEAR